MARITEHPDLLTCLVARHLSRKLVAIRSIGPKQFKGTITVTMQPECRISGRLVSKELDALDRSITWNAVYVYSGNKTPLARFSEQPTFHFYVPPGMYRLKAYGIETHNGYTAVTVPPDRSELELEPINLPPKHWALLLGQPAPELEEIIAWKNSRPLKLSELRGKVVLLEFWGSWCGPCVGRMPDLFSLHDKYHDQGLMIIGIHVDVGERIDSAAKLDEKLADVKKQLWNDRDIPFPVALVLERRVPFRPDVENKAGCPLAAEYGIDSVPTGILIDRQGRIVGMYFTSRESDEAVLKKTLEGK